MEQVATTSAKLATEVLIPYASIVKSNPSNMVIEEPKHTPAVDTMGVSNVGKTIKQLLLKAQSESRVTVGLSACINILSKTPEDSLFCLLAEPKKGDSATHMHEVLLEAFCYENDIYVVKVDSADKLSRILGQSDIESCALIQKSWTSNNEDESFDSLENALVDHCEAFWDAPQQPIIKLPAM